MNTSECLQSNLSEIPITFYITFREMSLKQWFFRHPSETILNNLLESKCFKLQISMETVFRNNSDGYFYRQPSEYLQKHILDGLGRRGWVFQRNCSETILNGCGENEPS